MLLVRSPLVYSVNIAAHPLSSKAQVFTERRICALSSSIIVVVAVYSDALMLAFAPVTETIHTITVSLPSTMISLIPVITKLTPVAHAGMLIEILFAV